jgi:hypothetical protein
MPRITNAEMSSWRSRPWTAEAGSAWCPLCHDSPNDGKEPDVTALVAGAERLLAEEVADRVDRERHLLEQKDPNQAGPDHRLEAPLPASAEEVSGDELVAEVID